jgi:cell division protein ZapE
VRAVAADAGFVLDPWQETAVYALDRLAGNLARRRLHRGSSRGIYLWGPVGRGKTWLVDAFFDVAPIDGKVRVHFHSLFRDLHAAVRANRAATHAFDAAVDELLSGCELVCFDEFHFHDIGDAMLVSRLLQRLLERRITLVATSNYPPSGLLPNPLYHHLFQPAIDLIGRHLDVLEVAGPTDYRTEARAARDGQGFGSGTVVWPGNEQPLAAHALRPPAAEVTTVLDVGTRSVLALHAEGRVAWFDFAQLCERRLSSSDLLALADRYSTWIVSSVPQLSSRPADAQQRFANLIDIAHDRDIKLTLICDVPPDALLDGELLVPDTERIASRLQLLTQPGP